VTAAISRKGSVDAVVGVELEVVDAVVARGAGSPTVRLVAVRAGVPRYDDTEGEPGRGVAAHQNNNRRDAIKSIDHLTGRTAPMLYYARSHERREAKEEARLIDGRGDESALFVKRGPTGTW
jgi:hypothetical protein